MTSKSDPLYNLADALAADIVVAPAAALVREAESDPGGGRAFVTAFDRIAARAAGESRQRRTVERLRGLLSALVPAMSWTSAMTAVASLGVVVVAGGLYFHQQAADVAPRAVLAERTMARMAPPVPVDAPKPSTDERSIVVNKDAAAVPPAPPAPVAAPPAAAPAPPPPAPPVAAGVADEPKRVRTVEIRGDTTPHEAATRAARRTLPERLAPRGDDRVAALAIAEEQKQFSVPSPASPAAAAVAPAPRPNAPAVPSRSTLAAVAGEGSPPGFAWPVRGRLVAGFGSSVRGVPNSGIDIAVAAGTDIRAAEDGVVLYVGNEIAGLGNLIMVRHRDDFITAYAHAQSIDVKVGDTIRRGQVIAKSGQTGTVRAPQLHFEIRKNAVPVDPAQYLPPG
jgi:murein DD-endopeptidase MepM/ murein hydrolase activator NlpD